MKVLFSKSIENVLRCAIKTSTGCFFMIFFLSLLTGTARAQNQDSGAVDNHMLHYGIHLGFTENKVDLYSNQGGTLHTSEDKSFYACGFRIAVIGEARLGRCFSLRVMPGLSLFSSLKMESVRSELPVDVKFHPFRWGKKELYLTSGLGYSFDFASRREDSHSYIKPLNAHDLRYNCGLGVDWYTRYVRVGLELKAGFGLLSPGTGGSNSSYFHIGPTFCLGLNIEA
ncbi:MAG: hypothetical protein J5848_06700 [Bacteroidales bacterium]|nr:hypothetical protein [Bacteroidales bacterium]